MGTLNFMSRKRIHTYITYINNCPLLCLSQDYGRTSYTIHVVCVNFIHEWCQLQFEVDSECQIFFEKFFVAILFGLTEFLPEICWKKVIAEEILVFIFSFWYLTWSLNRGLTSKKTTHYLLRWLATKTAI